MLFPLLSKLLEPFSAMDPLGREDTRVRAIQIVAKTFLNRLKELSSLPSFSNLWLHLLDFMEKYLRIDTHGTLTEVYCFVDMKHKISGRPGIIEKHAAGFGQFRSFCRHSRLV